MTLQLYQTLFIVFVSLTIIFAILSVVLFFLFDIRKIIRIKTGADMRQSMRELYDVDRGINGGRRKRYKARSVPLFKDTGSGRTGQDSSGMDGQNRPDSSGRTGQGSSGMDGQNRPDSSGMDGQNRSDSSGMTGQDRPDSLGMTGQNRPAGTGMTEQGRPAESGRTGQEEPVRQETACSREEQVTESLRSDGDRDATAVLTIPF